MTSLGPRDLLKSVGISRTVFLFAALMLSYAPAFATVILVTASNTSGYSVAVSTDTTTKNRILGGNPNNGGVSDCTSSGSVCDTCTGQGTGIVPCNHSAIGSTTVITIMGQTDNTTAVTARWPSFIRGDSSSSTPPGATSIPVDSIGQFGISLPWSGICELVTGDATCSASGVKTLQFGLGDSTSTERVDIEFVISAVDSSGEKTYTSCAGGAGAVTGDGYCSVSVRRGDEKVYAKDLYLANNSVDSVNSGIKWAGLVFFRGETAVGSENATLSSLRNNSDGGTSAMSYDNTQTPPNVDGRITGLSNDTYYCFIMANQDETGNIYNSTPIASLQSSGILESTLCATPGQVVGLLDDKKCFIATAAFGSPFEEHVKTLRTFRDRFLKTSSMGQAFVDFYYEKSPPIAQWIAHRDSVRAAVRFALMPAVGFAALSLEYGAIFSFALLLICSGIVMGLGLLWRRRRAE